MNEVDNLPGPEEALAGEIYDDEPFRPYSLEHSVNESVEDIDYIRKSDKAAIELCRQYARRIDLALAASDMDPEDHNLRLATTKALYLGPHLLNALKAIGGTPGDRMDLETKRTPANKRAGKPEPEKEEDPIASFLSANLAKERARREADK